MHLFFAENTIYVDSEYTGMGSIYLTLDTDYWTIAEGVQVLSGDYITSIFDKIVIQNDCGYKVNSEGKIYISDIVYKGYQTKDNDDGTQDIRLIATVKDLTAKNVGYVVLLDNSLDPGTSGTELKTNIVYESIITEEVTTTAESLGGNYILAYAIRNVPSTASVIYVYTYIEKADGSEIIEYAGIVDVKSAV